MLAENQENPSFSLKVYLKTVNTPKQRVFSACCAPFFLAIHKVFREKMASSGEKSLAVGHISGFQIDPIKGNPGETARSHRSFPCRFPRKFRKRRKIFVIIAQTFALRKEKAEKLCVQTGLFDTANGDTSIRKSQKAAALQRLLEFWRLFPLAP